MIFCRRFSFIKKKTQPDEKMELVENSALLRCHNFVPYCIISCYNESSNERYQRRPIFVVTDAAKHLVSKQMRVTTDFISTYLEDAGKLVCLIQM